jgi:hypothetical protein
MLISEEVGPSSDVQANAQSSGGAICALEGVNVNINNTLFSGSHSIYGGAILAAIGGELRIENSQFIGNTGTDGLSCPRHHASHLLLHHAVARFGRPRSC